MHRKVALVTGVTGQDGSYLAELLLSKGYEVHGLVRRASTVTTGRIEHLLDRLELHDGDLSDGASLRRLVDAVRVSFDSPVMTCDSGALGTLRLLEAVRDLQDRDGHAVRFYQASSSEMYGKVVETPQTEATPFYPRSPYAVGKVFSYWMTVNYREAYGIHASNGILFNHESPRRGETFVTRKITRAVGRIRHGLQARLALGNIDSKRDWGFAGDYVEAMWRMLQQDAGDDYVVATGETYTVRQFLDWSFGRAGLDWRDFVDFDPRMVRPTEVDLLLGDPAKAKARLGWAPAVSCRELAEMMTDHDLELAARERLLRDAGKDLGKGLARPALRAA